MSGNSNKLSVVNGYSATNYLPAILKEYKSGWIIEYYVENPSTQELCRKKIKLQRQIINQKVSLPSTPSPFSPKR